METGVSIVGSLLVFCLIILLLRRKKKRLTFITRICQMWTWVVFLTFPIPVKKEIITSVSCRSCTSSAVLLFRIFCDTVFCKSHFQFFCCTVKLLFFILCTGWWFSLPFPYHQLILKQTWPDLWAKMFHHRHFFPLLEINSKDWIPGFESQWSVTSRKLTGKWSFWRWFFFADCLENKYFLQSCVKQFSIRKWASPSCLSRVTSQSPYSGCFLLALYDWISLPILTSVYSLELFLWVSIKACQLVRSVEGISIWQA